jgi:agmatinase
MADNAVEGDRQGAPNGYAQQALGARIAELAQVTGATGDQR